MGVEDQPRDLVGFVRDDGLVEYVAERQIGQRALRRNPLGHVRGGDAGEHVARAQRGRARQQRLQIGEDVSGAAYCVRVGHGSVLLPSGPRREVFSPRRAMAGGDGRVRKPAVRLKRLTLFPRRAEWASCYSPSTSFMP